MVDYKTIIEVVDKLVGPCWPCGDSNADKERYEAMSKKIMLIDCLLDDIRSVAEDYKHSHEGSVVKAREAAIRYLKNTAEWLNEAVEDYEERK